MRLHLLALVSILAAGSTQLFADSFTPYGSVGSVAPTVTTYATGSDISAYFYSSNALDTDTISVFDVTTGEFLSPTNLLNNHTTIQGTSVVFSGANAGDQIAFDLTNDAYGDNTVLSSDPSLSTDGVNHAYITSFSGSVGKGDITGYYVGMEDLPKGSSDFDYNDDTFVVTGITTTPEPSSFLLLGTGLLAAAGVVRMKFTGEPEAVRVRE